MDALQQCPERRRSGRLAGIRELVPPGTPFSVPCCVKGRHIEIVTIMPGVRM